MVHGGAIVLKFWLQIDKEEQKRRFDARMENPKKQWKITEEDWRNREKWDLYEEAVNEMIIRTSTITGAMDNCGRKSKILMPESRFWKPWQRL